ncbi:hypothetical protein [Pedobacter sandarakinus]|uniref:hypothetical protein n=1 Tax=Pedobacter sandarakinus TaxID=353156 RepID=UPI00224728DD|nr:hypothetical protein [Pedobacter sandarakinus]MCX2575630.1 hypothetical protein [Pedobacter sandarakinus]
MKNKIIIVTALVMALGYTAGAQTTSQKIGENPTIKDASALLELEANNKGLLIPRVNLTSTTLAAPVTSPANALTVFNTNTAGDVMPGYYYWSLIEGKWIRLTDNTFYNGLELNGTKAGLGGTLDHDSKIFLNNKELSFMSGSEGLPFPSTRSTVINKNGIKLRYNDGGGALDPDIRDYYLSIENTRTVLNTNTQLGTPFDGITTGLKSIFTLRNLNEEKYIGGQFGAITGSSVGLNLVQIGVLAKADYNLSLSQANQVIGGYFEANNTSTGSLSNYALYAKATGSNPYALYADGGAVLIKDLNSAATPVGGAVRPVNVDANGKLVIGTSAMPGFFYAPSMVMPTSNIDLPNHVTYDAGNQTFTVDLYAVYGEQFGMFGDVSGASRTAIKSTGAGALPVLPATALGYFVTYFDNTVFDPSSITLSPSGLLTYKILATGTVGAKTYMNLVFKVL